MIKLSTAALIAIVAIFAVNGTLHAQDPYQKGVAGAQAEAARIKAAEQKRDAEEAARQRAAAEAAAERSRVENSRRSGTGEQQSVRDEAITVSPAK